MEVGWGRAGEGWSSSEDYLTDFPEDQSSVPNIHIWQLTTTLSPASGRCYTSGVLLHLCPCTYLHVYAYVWVRTHAHELTHFLKKLKSKQYPRDSAYTPGDPENVSKLCVGVRGGRTLKVSPLCVLHLQKCIPWG